MKTPSAQKPSIRYRVTTNRDVRFVLRQHSNLTVKKFRQHLETGLLHLRLAEESRLSWIRFFQALNLLPLPRDLRFWNVIQHADEMEQCYPARLDCRAERQVEELWRAAEHVPSTWIPAARHVLLALHKIREDARMELNRISNRLRKSWEGGEISGLVEAVRGGMIQELWVSQAIFNLQWQRVYGTTTEDQKQAEERLKQIADALVDIGRGKTEMPLEEKEQIVAACKKWRPICEGLNKAFKKLWKQSEYESSDLYRKEARGLLAEKYGISVKEVKTIERVLKTPSRRSNKSMPTEAMLQMVALDHVNRDVKTIEKIWGEYLNAHPEERRRKKRKLPTTPAVAERIA